MSRFQQPGSAECNPVIIAHCTCRKVRAVAQVAQVAQCKMTRSGSATQSVQAHRSREVIRAIRAGRLRLKSFRDSGARSGARSGTAPELGKTGLTCPTILSTATLKPMTVRVSHAEKKNSLRAARQEFCESPAAQSSRHPVTSKEMRETKPASPPPTTRPLQRPFPLQALAMVEPR